jgi:acetyl-CoA acyltransferase
MSGVKTRAYFLSGLRTPFGKSFKGAYADVRPDDLMVELIGGHRQRFGSLWDSNPDEFILGCAYPEGEQGYNLARPIALGSKLPIPALTINRLCASSLDAAILAAAKIRAGLSERVLVGGVESMSRIPRRGANFSESDRVKLGCALAYIPNGDTAERVAAQYPTINRRQQEDFSARSHELADIAFQLGKYESSILPFKIAKDEFIRVPVDREKMASLAPAFAEKGVVTAATSSPLTDGATLGCVLDERGFLNSEIEFGVEIVDAVSAHVAPEVMGMGPVPATKKLLKRNGLQVSDIAAWEFNEAFAIQVLAALEELRINLDKVNTWGGALALGHPLGASGLRLMITLLHRLATEHETNAMGVASLCVGGGQGVSVLVRFVRKS